MSFQCRRYPGPVSLFLLVDVEGSVHVAMEKPSRSAYCSVPATQPHLNGLSDTAPLPQNSRVLHGPLAPLTLSSNRRHNVVWRIQAAAVVIEESKLVNILRRALLASCSGSTRASDPGCDPNLLLDVPPIGSRCCEDCRGWSRIPHVAI